MRGEGTRAVVSRSIAAFRTWRSCTPYFTTEALRNAEVKSQIAEVEPGS